MQHLNKNLSWFIAGTLFAILWASASTATKIGLTVAQPLIIAEMRFALASCIMLLVAHFIFRHRLPAKKEWKQLAVYGFLNISVYLGLYVFAMQKITAGIGALAVAANPVIMSFLSVFFLKKKLNFSIILSIVVCVIGVICAAFPLFKNSSVSVEGLLVLFLSMLSYSIGAIYFSFKSWEGLSLLTINGWQSLLGGLFLLPVALLFYDKHSNHFSEKFWISTGWLAILVSVFAVQLWLWLLKLNPIRAGLWLFLCPLYGFIIAAWLLNDVISLYTIAGITLVILGLLLSRMNIKKSEVLFD